MRSGIVGKGNREEKKHMCQKQKTSEPDDGPVEAGKIVTE